MAEPDPRIDLSGPHRGTFNTLTPDAGIVADPFHVIKYANSKVDERRRRVQKEALGHRRSEAVKNLMKRGTRAAFGRPRYRHYRIRSLLEVGRPNRYRLTSIRPR